MNFEFLDKFFTENHMAAKGALCVGLVVTREAVEKGLPLDFESLKRKYSGNECRIS